MGVSPDEWAANGAPSRLSYPQWRDEVRIAFLLERGTAEEIACPHCDAPAAVTCRNPITDEVLGGAPAHWQRIRARSRTGPATAPSTSAAPSGRRSTTRSLVA